MTDFSVLYDSSFTNPATPIKIFLAFVKIKTFLTVH